MRGFMIPKPTLNHVPLSPDLEKLNNSVSELRERIKKRELSDMAASSIYSLIESKLNSKDGELTESESDFILRDTLSVKHFNDSKVIEFIDAFVRCKSIPQASAECGIHNSLGYKYRHRRDIANAISKLIAKSAIKGGFDASEVLERAKEIADVDPIHVQNRDGSFKSNLHSMPAEVRRCLKKLKVKNLWNESEDMNGVKTKIIIGELIEYEFYDKIKAIDLVGKEKDMFKTTTKVEHGVTKDMAQILLDSSKRAQKAVEDQQGIVPAEYNIVGDNDE